MAADVQIFDDASGLLSRHARFTNIEGTMLTAALVYDGPVPSGGLALAGTYSLVALPAELGHDVTVTPESGDPWTVFLPAGTILATGVVLPGVQLTFTLLNPELSYESEVLVGWNAGTLVAGSTSLALRLFARNVGEDTGIDARIEVLPDAHWVNLSEEHIIQGVYETGLPRTIPIGTWRIELADLPDPYRFDVYFNEEYEETVDAVSTGPNFDLILTTGPALALWSLFSASVGDSAEVTISPGFLDFTLAPDIAGAPGEFSAAALLLGTMDPDETIPFWIRVESDPARLASGNPYRAQLEARITSV